MRPYLEKTHYKKGLVEWLKVKALSSSTSTEGKKSTAWAGSRAQAVEHLPRSMSLNPSTAKTTA
jgi:hypothetical protein